MRSRLRWLLLVPAGYALGVLLAGPVGRRLDRWDRRRCRRG